jgi:hypothetical protein
MAMGVICTISTDVFVRLAEKYGAAIPNRGMVSIYLRPAGNPQAIEGGNKPDYLLKCSTIPHYATIQEAMMLELRLTITKEVKSMPIMYSEEETKRLIEASVEVGTNLMPYVNKELLDSLYLIQRNFRIIKYHDIRPERYWHGDMEDTTS